MTAPFASPDNRNLLIGKGEMYLDIHRSGAKTGYFHLGTLDAAELGTNDTFLEKFSNMKQDSALYARRLQRRVVNFRMVIAEFSLEAMEILTMGTPSVTSNTATPVVDEVLTQDVVLGHYYKLGGMGPYTAITVEEGPAPGSALVLGTDYEVYDADKGIIKILETSPTLATGDPVIASYTPTAHTTIHQLAGGASSTIEATGLFLPDPSTGPKYMYEFWNMSLSPDGVIGLISEEWASAAVNGAVQNDAAGNWGGSPSFPLYRATLLE